jgi:hypothetical protein
MDCKNWTKKWKKKVKKNYELSDFLNFFTSISEALARGKPLIILPFFGDQSSNAALVIYSGVGIKLLSQGNNSPIVILFSDIRFIFLVANKINLALALHPVVFALSLSHL